MANVSDLTLYQSTLTPEQVDTALKRIADLDLSEIASVVSYTITVPTYGWTTGSLDYGGATYTLRCTVYTSQATSNPTGLMMEYAGGDYDAYCTVALIDTQAGSVVLWASADPEATCQIKITEVRSGE